MQSFRQRACQSLSHTIKQENPDKPVHIEWEKRGERQIIMAADYVWDKWEQVIKSYEAGGLIDLDTGKEVKLSDNYKELTNLHNIQSTALRGLQGLTSDQLEQAANHILAKPPKIYIGKHPRKWTRAHILEKWCERRKWKDVVIRAIGDQIAYARKKNTNQFVDDKGNLIRERWVAWKAKRHYNSCIMEAIVRSNGMVEYIKLVITASKKTPKYPPQAALYKIDQAISNACRAEKTLEGNWSKFVLWRLEQDKLSNSTCEFGVGGRLLPSTTPFVEKKITAGILDLCHFPLVFKEAELTTSWHKMTEKILLRCLKMGAKEIRCWMIIAPVERQSHVDIMRNAHFKVFKRKTVPYVYQSGEPFGKTRDPNVSITYLEKRTILSNGQPKYFSDDIDQENFFSDKFNKREVYRIEHKGFINVDELRMETYL